MAVPPPYPHAGFLAHLTLAGGTATSIAAPSLAPALTQLFMADGAPFGLTQAGKDLITLLAAQKATLQSAYDTAVVADELRRYQRFAKAGQLSPHIVQLRQQQSAVRLAGSLSKQSYIKAAATFVRAVRIAVPEKVALELYISRWISINIPKDIVA